MLMGRHTRTQLPTTPMLLEPQYPTQRIKQGLACCARNQERYYNQHVKELKPLSEGDPVRVRKPAQRIRCLTYADCRLQTGYGWR